MSAVTTTNNSVMGIENKSLDVMEHNFNFFFLQGIQTFGRNVLVAGRSKNVGMPIAMLLHTDGEHERPGGESRNVPMFPFIKS